MCLSSLASASVQFLEANKGLAYKPNNPYHTTHYTQCVDARIIALLLISFFGVKIPFVHTCEMVLPFSSFAGTVE